jgi:hypothetical protein
MPEYPDTITLRRPDDWQVHLRAADAGEGVTVHGGQS